MARRVRVSLLLCLMFVSRLQSSTRLDEMCLATRVSPCLCLTHIARKLLVTGDCTQYSPPKKCLLRSRTALSAFPLKSRSLPPSLFIRPKNVKKGDEKRHKARRARKAASVATQFAPGLPNPEHIHHLNSIPVFHFLPPRFLSPRAS